MADAMEITVDLPADQMEAVVSAVSTGEYASSGAVVREALAQWKDRRESLALDPARLGRLWDEGLASGPPEPLDVEDVKARGRALLNSRRMASND